MGGFGAWGFIARGAAPCASWGCGPRALCRRHRAGTCNSLAHLPAHQFLFLPSLPVCSELLSLSLFSPIPPLQVECLRVLSGLGVRLDGKDNTGKKPIDMAKGDAARYVAGETG